VLLSLMKRNILLPVGEDMDAIDDVNLIINMDYERFDEIGRVFTSYVAYALYL